MTQDHILKIFLLEIALPNEALSFDTHDDSTTIRNDKVRPAWQVLVLNTKNNRPVRHIVNKQLPQK